MDGGRSARCSPKGPGPPSSPGSWTQGQESGRGPGGPTGAQPSFSLCSVSAPSQFRDPAQAAPEQQETQRPPGWKAPQALQPAQQAAEACSAGCEYPQVETGLAEATHQDAGGPLSAQPDPGCGRCHLCPARAPGPPACSHSSHHPLPSSHPGPSSVSYPSRSCPPCHRAHHLCPLLGFLGRPGLVSQQLLSPLPLPKMPQFPPSPGNCLLQLSASCPIEEELG